jgi:hypothetical protein
MSRARLIILGLALAAAFAAGYGWGSAGRREPQPFRALAAKAPPAPGLGADLQRALLIPDALARAREVARILGEAPPEALGDVRAAYDSAFLANGSIELVLLAEWWARFDPASALDWARDSRIGWNPAVLAAVMGAWARQDPDAAVRAAREEIRDARLLTAGVTALVLAWEESGESGLQDYLERGAGGDPAVLEALARAKVLRQGPDAAIAWAESFPEPEPRAPPLRKNALVRVAGALVELDPQRAARFALETPWPGPRTSLYLRVGTRWAERDGEAALRWLAGVPEGGDRDVAVQETFRTWLGRERDAAARWLRAAEPGAWLDPARAQYALSLANDSPLEAIAWAERVSDPKRRERTLVRIAASWQHRAPEEARAWLEQAGLSDDAREQVSALLARIEKQAARKQVARPSPSAAAP